MVWTQEMRDKAMATRLARKQARIENLQAVKPAAKEGLSVHTAKGDDGHSEAGVALPGRAALSNHALRSKEQEFDWENCPLVDAINKQADMRREFERVSAILLRRQNPPGKRWTCWTQENLNLIRGNFSPPNARAVIQACLRSGEDGRQSFRDDGRFVIENGVKRLKPAFCCNAFCFKAYQQLHKQEQVAV
jgi:hypothetical protein